MLTKTSEIAVKALLYISLHNDDTWISPKAMAAPLDVSPSYLSKIVSGLVKADLLRAQRGAHGGVQLSHPPGSITLLEIVEACQGKILGDYCQETGDGGATCAYHEAMRQLHEATVEVLQRWTLADLRVCPEYQHDGPLPCKMYGVAS